MDATKYFQDESAKGVHGKFNACMYRGECREKDEQLRELKGLLAELLTKLGERDRGDGNAPGHGHEVPGIWDSDNGKLAGKPCAWCATWAKAREMGLMTPNA